MAAFASDSERIATVRLVNAVTAEITAGAQAALTETAKITLSNGHGGDKTIGVTIKARATSPGS